uniref:Uncharacterized protein n=1 Tax=viral metagenome TaxID=1070528 RepID=A0A6M3LCG0_9ZZZZ
MSTITIRLPLPQLNDVLRESKAHWAAYAGPKKKITRAIAMQAMAESMPRIYDAYNVDMLWYPPNGLVDPDNLAHGAKYILDALVLGGTLPGDGYKWVRSLNHEFCPPDKANPRVVVTVTPEQ